MSALILNLGTNEVFYFYYYFFFLVQTKLQVVYLRKWKRRDSIKIRVRYLIGKKKGNQSNCVRPNKYMFGLEQQPNINFCREFWGDENKLVQYFGIRNQIHYKSHIQNLLLQLFLSNDRRRKLKTINNWGFDFSNTPIIVVLKWASMNNNIISRKRVRTKESKSMYENEIEGRRTAKNLHNKANR